MTTNIRYAYINKVTCYSCGVYIGLFNAITPCVIKAAMYILAVISEIQAKVVSYPWIKLQKAGVITRGAYRPVQQYCAPTTGVLHAIS